MSLMLHLTAVFRPCPPHERFTTGTSEEAWSDLCTSVYTGQRHERNETKMTIGGKLVPSSQKRRKLRHTLIRQSEHLGGNSNS